jgi:hypothetical protein
MSLKHETPQRDWRVRECLFDQWGLLVLERAQ